MRRALDALQQGRTARAERLCRAILVRDPDANEALHLLGVLVARRRNVGAALALFERAARLRRSAHHVRACAVALERLGRLDEAISAFRALVALAPDDAEGHAGLGDALRRAGRLQEAASALREAVRLGPGRATVHTALAITLRRLGCLAEAADAARAALTLDPGHAPAHSSLGHALAGLDRLAEAAAAFRAAARHAPADADAHANLGAALLGLNRFGEAASACAQAVRLAPGHANALANLGFALAGLDRLDEAAAACAEAIRLAPGHAGAHANLGLALLGLARFEEGVAALEAAIARAPGDAKTHWNLGMALLLLGRFERGWKEYEHRPRPQLAQPQWRGETLAGRTVLLHAEQGLGDTLQFVRYIPEVARRGGRVLLATSPTLHRLLAGLPGVHRLLASGQAAEFNLHCPLLSLPGVLGTTPDTVPAPVPYLHAEPALLARWRERLGGLGGLRVGLVWAGNPGHGNDRNRSIAFQQLAPFWRIPGVEWVSLQVGPRAADLCETPTGVVVRDLGPDLHDFAETAAVMGQLDLILTVDTAVAHLAGALGRPTWVMLPFVPDWRWMLGREDSPWYPTLRLFRQPRAGHWESVIERITDALKRMQPLRGP